MLLTHLFFIHYLSLVEENWYCHYSSHMNDFDLDLCSQNNGKCHISWNEFNPEPNSNVCTMYNPIPSLKFAHICISLWMPCVPPGHLWTHSRLNPKWELVQLLPIAVVWHKGCWFYSTHTFSAFSLLVEIFLSLLSSLNVENCIHQRPKRQ